MEPLAPVSAPEESMFNKEELVIASIRSATKELQTAVELQCKASFDRIMTLGQCLTPLFYPSSCSSVPPLLAQTLKLCFSHSEP